MTKIVIIEDHPVMRNGLAAWFEGSGRWSVTGTASSLAEAKDLLACFSATGQKPDLLLLDIQLEDGWGLDIITWYQAHFAKQAHFATQSNVPPAAVYSVFDDYAHVNAALAMGVRAYVTKRRSETELEEALLRVLEGKLYIDEAAQIKFETVKDLFSLLTKREAEILSLVKTGLSNKQVAANLGISCRTVENILSCVYDKTGIRSRMELLRL